MKIHNFPAATLLGALITSVTLPSFAVTYEYPGSGCYFIDLNGWTYYVNNAQQHISLSGPTLTNNTGTTLWATCPLPTTYATNFTCGIEHNGATTECYLCVAGIGQNGCFVPGSAGLIPNTGVYQESFGQHYTADSQAWNVQCKLPTGYSLYQYAVSYVL